MRDEWPTDTISEINRQGEIFAQLEDRTSNRSTMRDVYWVKCKAEQVGDAITAALAVNVICVHA